VRANADYAIGDPAWQAVTRQNLIEIPAPWTHRRA